MTQTVTLPLWLLVLILLFAVVAALDNVMLPSVRWYLRRRLERAVARLNENLERPIEPFKLARRYDMIQRLIYQPDVSRAVVEHAKTEGVPENVAFEEAQRYAREIVPSFSASLYFGFAIRLAKWLSTSLYRVRLGRHDDEKLAKIDRAATVVFVMNHRSNMDYVLVTYLAAERSALSYAVGEWAQVWPLSRLIRAMGAYFIRRQSRNDLYRAVLAGYVRLATEGGVTQAMFPEGGLSLSGGIRPPKLGLLKYILDGFDPDIRDVVFVPVALNYDRVLEDRILLAAQARGDRKFRARISVITGFFLRQIWLRMTGRFHRFGYAAVSFGDPISLSAHTKAGRDISPKALARDLMNRIGDVLPVLPVPVVAHIMSKGDRLTRSEIELAFSRTVTSLPSAHVHLPRNNRDYAVEVGLRALVKRGAISEQGGSFQLVEAQRPLVEYYAQSIQHHLSGDIADAAQHSDQIGS